MKNVLRLLAALAATTAIMLATAPDLFAAATVIGIEQVSSVRAGRTSFDYTYKIRVQNGPTALPNARAIATSSNPATVIIKGTVMLGNLAPNALVTSVDTFTIRQDRTVPYVPNALNWQVVGDQAQGVPAALAALEAAGQIPVLDRSASLLGPDANANGVRDDVDSYIDSLPDTAPQKSAMRQASKAIALALILGVNAGATPAELRNADTTIGRAVTCIWKRYDATAASAKVAAIEKAMVNTRARFDAYDLFNTKRTGTSSRLPLGDTCETP